MASLPEVELLCFESHLRLVSLVAGQVLHEAGEEILEVYFPEHGLTYAVAESAGEQNYVEVGLTGKDSMVGLTAVLSADPVAYNRFTVHCLGEAYKLPVGKLHEALEFAPTLRLLLLDNLQIFLAQISQTAACNSKHPLQLRAARWLLTAHDRCDGNEIMLTHDILAALLGVRRAAISTTLSTLAKGGIIAQQRGFIRVLDRPALEAASCGCYVRLREFAERLRHKRPLAFTLPALSKA